MKAFVEEQVKAAADGRSGAAKGEMKEGAIVTRKVKMAERKQSKLTSDGEEYQFQGAADSCQVLKVAFFTWAGRYSQSRIDGKKYDTIVGMSRSVAV